LASAPLIAKVDRYLAGWKATLLSSAGRAVLVNSVLDGAMMLPLGVRDAINARQRAFLWTGTEATSGARCLVAWESVCKPKEDNGLGMEHGG
jgi:hypothetical protein